MAMPIYVGDWIRRNSLPHIYDDGVVGLEPAASRRDAAVVRLKR